MATTSISQQEIDAGLLYPNFYWPAGTTITYSIPNGGTLWAANYGSNEPTTSYSEFNAAQAAQFVAALEIWDSYIANSMVQVDDGATYGDIRGAFTDIPEANVAGKAYSPPFQGNAFSAREGDVWIDISRTGSTFATGTQDFQLLLHEIGHALGLKHPFESPTLPSQYDNHAYTVMSYTPADQRIVFTGGGGSISWSMTPTADKTPMVLDIAAVQSRYGADTQTGAGNTTYAFTDADLDGRQAIYDANGNDTIDISALSRGSTLDLRPGAYSDLAYYAKADQVADTKARFPGFDGFIDNAFNQPGVTVYEWTRNVGIAFSTVIENAVGSALSDTIIGNDAANRLDGGLGLDVLTGGAGLDAFHGKAASLSGDRITDLANGETITLDDAAAGITAASLTSGTLTVSYRIGTGAVQSFAMTVAGDFSGFSFSGRTITFGQVDTNDTFVGQAGNQTYDGGGGIDTVNYAAASGPLAVDLALTGFQAVGGGFGSDRLLSIENLRGGTGNDTLSGNASANTIWGGAGNDAILGREGVDTLRGEAGNDTLDGGTGADRLYGAGGNDTYIVDAAGDLVREDTVAGVDDGGTDLVRASVTYTLKAFVENLTLTGAAAINGTGNALANTINGNNVVNRLSGMDGNDKLFGFGGEDILRGGEGNDSLAGGAGADNMDGGNGSDTYMVDALDIVRDTGASGVDTVIASSTFKLKAGDGIENLRFSATGTGDLTGNELGNAITAFGGNNGLMGLAGNDTIRAGAGNDTIRGGIGQDKLYGEAGADTFVFAKGESIAQAGPSGADQIFDFATGADHIDLAIFGTPPVASAYGEVKINSDSFAALKIAAQDAMTGSQRAVFVAGATNGWLFWSTDGADGTVEEAVQLMGRNTLAGFDRGDIV